MVPVRNGGGPERVGSLQATLYAGQERVEPQEGPTDPLDVDPPIIADSSFPRRRRPASEAVRTFGSDAKGFLMPPNAAALARSRTCFAEGSLAPLKAHGPW